MTLIKVILLIKLINFIIDELCAKAEKGQRRKCNSEAAEVVGAEKQGNET